MQVQIPEAFSGLFDPPIGSVRYRGFYGGRGSGKSWAVARALVLHAHAQPLRILCAREVEKSIKDSLKRLLDDTIRSLGLADAYESLETEIRGRRCGSLFLFGGLLSHVDSIKSKEGLDIAWLEEAAAVSRRGLETLTPTLRKDGSEVWATWNPRSPKDPIDHMFRGPGGFEETKNPRAIVRRVNWHDNPWFPKVLREDMLEDRARDPDKYAHVWLGEYEQRSEARVFHNWRVEAFDPPPAGTKLWYGADWGFSIDPTVLIRAWFKGRTLFVDHELHKVGLEIDRTPEFFRRMPDAQRWTIRADSARPETISYMQRHGFPKMVAALKGAGSVEDGIEFLKSFDIVVHPRCEHLADELARYSYKIDKRTGDVLPVLDERPGVHVNVIHALRYAVEGIRNAPAALQVQDLVL